MKYGFFLLLAYAFFLTTCSSTHTIKEDVAYGATIGFDGSSSTLSIKNRWFNESLANSYKEEAYISNTGDELLQQIIKGYSSQLPSVKYITDDPEVTFILKDVTVGKFWFSPDLFYMGLYYRITLEADILVRGEPANHVKLERKVNGALLNFEDKQSSYLMNQEEKGNEVYQRKAFEYGLRQLYQELYFDYFDIKLQL